MSPMFKQAVGMTEIYSKGIAELFLIRCNPYHWDGSGEVPDDVKFDVYKRKIDETYDGARSKFSFVSPMAVFAMRRPYICTKADSGRDTALAASTRLRFAMTPVLSMP